MKRTLCLLTFLMMSNLASAQTSDAREVSRQNAEQMRQEYASRRDEEKKLDWLTYFLLRDAEQADTSVVIRKRFKKRLTTETVWQTDNKDRVRVMLDLSSADEVPAVCTLVDSLGGFVMEHGTYVPYVECRIHPLDFRALIACPAIREVSRVIGPIRWYPPREHR